MNKFGNFVVKGRYWFLSIFFVLLVASAVLMNFVHVNYDLTEYLPDNSNTKQSIQLMKDEFGATGTAGMMLKNVEKDDATKIAEEIQDFDTVSTCVVSRTQIKDDVNYCMLNIFLKDSDYTTEAEKTLQKIEEFMPTKLAENQSYYMIGSAVTAVASREAITSEIPIIMLVAVLIVLLVLTITSRSWIEPLIYLIVIGSAILINMGTNFFLGSISFVSNSIASVLLIALAMDYSIVLVNRFREEREKNENVFDAMKAAISGSIVTIVASGCTVMAGLISLVFMDYRIGMDMGLVLTKGVFISLLAVVFLMPAVLLLFAKLIQKTEHKNFLRGLTKIGTFAKKTRFVFPIVFLCLIGGAFAIQSQMLSFDYAAKFNKSGNPVYENEQAVKEIFGEQNALVVIFKTKDGETVTMSDAAQLELFDRIKNIEVEVDGEKIKPINADSSFLTSGDYVDLSLIGKTEPLYITLGTFVDEAYMAENFGLPEAEAVDAQIHPIMIRQIGEKYGYATESNNSITVYNAIKFAGNEQDRTNLLQAIENRLAILESLGMIDSTQHLVLLFTYGEMINFVAESAPLEQQAEDVYFSKDKTTTRMIFNINADTSSPVAISTINALHKIFNDYYTNQQFFVVNNTQNIIETDQVFKTDRLKVELISALAILLICLISFRSVSLPVILVLIIQGSIWINLAANALFGNSIFFICYLLGTAIQMGATIDYGILLVDRYKEARKTQDKFTAIKTAIDKSFATIISSGSILTLAALTIGLLSSVPLISSIGYLVGCGALLASLTILFVLPQTLLLLDKLVAKTTLKSNFLYEPKTSKVDETKVVETTAQKLDDCGNVENFEILEEKTESNENLSPQQKDKQQNQEKTSDEEKPKLKTNKKTSKTKKSKNQKKSSV